eukprot:732351-Rhodomonas_salina.2
MPAVRTADHGPYPPSVPRPRILYSAAVPRTTCHTSVSTAGHVPRTIPSVSTGYRVADTHSAKARTHPSKVANRAVGAGTFTILECRRIGSEYRREDNVGIPPVSS